jgi:hypothetical protein
VLFLGFLRVLEEWKKWEILYKKSYKIFIFYRYVRGERLMERKRLGIYIYGRGGLAGSGIHPADVCLPFIYHRRSAGIIQGCGGGGSVRRRNTLHEVGGRE